MYGCVKSILLYIQISPGFETKALYSTLFLSWDWKRKTKGDQHSANVAF